VIQAVSLNLGGLDSFSTELRDGLRNVSRLFSTPRIPRAVRKKDSDRRVRLVMCQILVTRFR
jgi:hypothetical protein